MLLLPRSPPPRKTSQFYFMAVSQNSGPNLYDDMVCQQREETGITLDANDQASVVMLKAFENMYRCAWFGHLVRISIFRVLPSPLPPA